MIIYAYSVACATRIYPLPSITSYPLAPLAVSFLDTLVNTKATGASIYPAAASLFHAMSFLRTVGHVVCSGGFGGGVFVFGQEGRGPGAGVVVGAVASVFRLRLLL